MLVFFDSKYTNIIWVKQSQIKIIYMILFNKFVNYIYRGKGMKIPKWQLKLAEYLEGLWKENLYLNMQVSLVYIDLSVVSFMSASSHYNNKMCCEIIMSEQQFPPTTLFTKNKQIAPLNIFPYLLKQHGFQKWLLYNEN